MAALICSVAKALKIPLVATCVESATELADIRRRGFELVQGHAVAPILEAAQVPDWLRHGGQPAALTPGTGSGS